MFSLDCVNKISLGANFYWEKKLEFSVMTPKFIRRQKTNLDNHISLSKHFAKVSKNKLRII